MHTRPGKGALYPVMHVCSVPNTALLFLAFDPVSAGVILTFLLVRLFLLLLLLLFWKCSTTHDWPVLGDILKCPSPNRGKDKCRKRTYDFTLRRVWIFSSRTAIRCSYSVIQCGNTLCYCWHFCTCYRTLSILLRSVILPGICRITTFRLTTDCIYDGGPIRL